MYKKISQDKAKGILLVPLWPTQPWFPLVLQLLYRQPWIIGPSPQLLTHVHIREPHPLQKSLRLMVCFFIRNTFTQQNLSADITDILMASWRRGTQAQYKTYVEKWLAFCDKRKINNSFPKINEALEFLNSLYKQGLSYSTINTARSALSAILNVGEHTFGSHPLVTRFFKGLYEINKPEPKYKYIWDVNTVLEHL